MRRLFMRASFSAAASTLPDSSATGVVTDAGLRIRAAAAASIRIAAASASSQSASLYATAPPSDNAGYVIVCSCAAFVASFASSKMRCPAVNTCWRCFTSTRCISFLRVVERFAFAIFRDRRSFSRALPPPSSVSNASASAMASSQRRHSFASSSCSRYAWLSVGTSDGTWNSAIRGTRCAASESGGSRRCTGRPISPAHVSWLASSASYTALTVGCETSACCAFRVA
mmetsp:Transcript_20193/g.34383  ORF Transcript_20193/g.34383 Transcript_20193/m.34383 type:complete len:228 (-) Transcript_20193:470-1153(-)